MIIAAFESSTHHLSVALWCEGRLSRRAEHVANGGSAQLLPWLSQLLAEAGLQPGAIDALAFGAGPGAFTGLRLSCGLAQGLGFGLDVPVLGISSLEALAWQCGGHRVAACLDARMDEVYYAYYELADAELHTVQAPACAAPAALPRPPGEGWQGVGDAFAVYPQLLQPGLVSVRAELWPDAAAVAQLAAPRLARGEGVAAALAAPLYVRNKVALTTAERIARGGVR